MRTDFLDIKGVLEEKFGEGVWGFEEGFEVLGFCAEVGMNLKVLTFLKEVLGFDFLVDLTGVHVPLRKGKELEVVYHVSHLEKKLRLRMKVSVGVERPDVFTATALFSGANWMERETFDFFGINFVGHPNLKRILNVEEMDYFPLRKEYALEDNMRLDKDDEMFGRKGLKENL